MRCLEDFCARYENVGLSSFNSEFFVPCAEGATRDKWPPFYLNQRCYTVFLVNHATGCEFRGRYNEDTDMTLQTLTAGWCTILLNAFCISTPATMTATGGQTSIYQADGRLKMSRDLERRWPGVVTTSRRFNRPQHKIKGQWKMFDTPLIPRKDVVISDEPNEYGLKLSGRTGPNRRNLTGKTDVSQVVEKLTKPRPKR